MKYRLNTMKIFKFLILITIYQNSIAEESMKEVYFGKTPGLKNYDVRLQIPKGWDEQGDYTKITIYKKGKSVFELTDLQATSLNNVDKFPKQTKNMGKYLKIFPVGLKAPNSQILLAFSNWRGGSAPDELILINFSKDVPKKIFQESIKLTAIEDFDKDGYYDLLKLGGRGEPTGENNFSYDPFLIYRQIRIGDEIEFKVDEELSKKWSSKNSFYWHGLKYNDKIRVDKKGELVPQI